MDSLGLTWEEIPEEAEPRADFRASDGRCHYLFEVKQREDDKDYEATLARAGHAVLQQSLGRLNRISSLITGAARQLRATPATPDTLRVVVFVAAGREAEVQEKQFRSTLYGEVDLITHMEGGQAVARPCFYFSFSEFYRLPDVDAALTILGPRCRMYLNDFSRRLDTLRVSQLYQTIDQSGAVVDPKRLESAEDAFIADCDIDRRDQDSVLSYVKDKYALQTAITFEPVHVKSGVVLPWTSGR
jgi:hypothetical protein